MTVVADEMLIRIAADTAQLRNDMNEMRRQVGGSFDDIKDRAASLKSFLTNMFAGVAVGAVAKQFVETADAMALMDARLKQTTGNAEDFAAAQSEIYRIAQANNAGLQETAALFTKMNEPVKRLGGGVKETAAIVDAFSTSMRLGGASTQEASAATLQFAQAMGSGKLQGDEFRSIAEASPRFMKAMAEGMGVPIEKLKEMGGEGKLTADVVGNALIKSLDQLKSEAGSMPDTVGGAFQRVKNDIMVAVNELNQNSGLTLGIADVISGVNQLIPTIKGELAGAFEAVGEWIGRNREGIGEIWGTAKGLMGDVWELVKGFGSVLGFVIEVGVQSGAFKTILETIRFLVAGLQDGVKIIGAAFAVAGADIIDFFTAPLQDVLKLIGTLADKVGLDFGKSLISAAHGIEKISMDARKYGEGIFEAFENGDTAVGKLNAELLKNKEAANAASSGTKVASEVMDALAGTAGKAAGGLVTLKGKSAELTKEQKEAADAYKKLLKSIDDKTAAMSGELTSQAKLSDGQKAALKVMNDIRDGTVKLTNAQKVKITAALEDMLATEKLTDAQKEEQKILKEVQEQRSKDAEAMLKQAASMDEQTQKLKDENAVLAGTSKSIEQLELARLKDQRAILAQTVATEQLLGYCNEETEAHRETLRALDGLIKARENNVHLKAAKDSADEWKKTADTIGDSLTDALMRGFESGKGFLRNLRDTAVNAFKTLVLQPTIKATLSSGAGVLGSLFGTDALAASRSGGESAGLGSLMGGISSLFGVGGLSGALTAGAGWLTGATSLSGALGAAGSLIGTGSAGGIASGLAMGAGALGPIALGVAGVMSLLKKFDTSGTKHTGGATLAGANGGYMQIDTRELGFAPGTVQSAETQKLTTSISTSIVSLLNSTAQNFGKTAGYTAATAFADDTSKDGAWGALMIKNAMGTVVDWNQNRNSGWAPREYEDGKAGLDQYMAEIGTSVRTALNSIGLPTWATEMLDKIGAGATLEQLAATVDQINATRASLAAVGNQFSSMGGVFSQVAGLSDDAKLSMIALAGGLDQLIGKANQFVKDFYTEQEQAGVAARDILAQLQKVGIDASNIGSKEEYRTLVESLDLSSATQREQLNALLTMGPQFASITDFMAENRLSLAELAEFAPVIAALDPMFAKQAEAVNQSTTAIDATKAAVDGVQSAVTAGANATVAAINGLSGSIQSAISSVAQASAASAAALSARIDAVESNSRLAASAPY